MGFWTKIWRRLVGKVDEAASKTENDSPSAELLALMAGGRASALREGLRAHLSHGNITQKQEAICRLATELKWGATEQEKLRAYCEFFTGESAQGYHRVIRQGLARIDYPLFMTACVYCYNHDRYQEARVLLEQFDPAQATELDQSEYHAFAGYLTLAGGGPIGDATRHFDAALDAGLLSPLLAVNAYPIYFEAGDHEQGRQLRQIIQDHYREDPEATYAVACVELARGYYPEGFRLAEARYHMPEAHRSINATLLSHPRWQGEDIAGKTLLVHGEQGYGDLIMMLRYIPDLRRRGCSIVLDCREGAISLVEHNFPDCKAIPGKLSEPIFEPFDLWTGIMSLPHLFNSTAQTIPATSGYLTVPEEQANYWRDRLPKTTSSPGRPRPRIGLAWSGNPGHRADLRRSLGLEQLLPHLARHPEITFFSLQTSPPPGLPPNLLDLSEELVTLADTAALIGQMDLVITVDTSAVHLAGALSKATWLLLPHRYEWRWGLEGEGNPWYQSVQVLRQSRHGDWETLLSDTFGKRLTAWLAQFDYQKHSSNASQFF